MWGWGYVMVATLNASVHRDADVVEPGTMDDMTGQARELREEEKMNRSTQTRQDKRADREKWETEAM